MNLHAFVNVPDSSNYHKIHVRIFCFAFSHAVINDLLGWPNVENHVKLPFLNKIALELTSCVRRVWPRKGGLVASNLSIKYDVLHKIEIVSGIPSYNGTKVIVSLAQLSY